MLIKRNTISNQFFLKIKKKCYICQELMLIKFKLDENVFIYVIISLLFFYYQIHLFFFIIKINIKGDDFQPV